MSETEFTKQPIEVEVEHSEAYVAYHKADYDVDKMRMEGQASAEEMVAAEEHLGRLKDAWMKESGFDENSEIQATAEAESQTDK